MSAQVISFNCVLKNKTGQFISSTFSREVLTSTAETEGMLAGLARGLQNLTKGEKRSIALRAEEAYGFYDPQKIILFPKKRLPLLVRIGQFITVAGQNGQNRTYKVLAFHDSLVSLDGNHPLAGQDLIFEIETLDAREATHDEITQSVNSVSEQILH